MEANPLAVGMGIAVVVMAGIGLVILIALSFYCLTLQKALGRVAPENRAMAPGLVWLLPLPIVINIPLSFVPALKILVLLVGLFMLVWHFIIVLKVAASLGAEFKKRGIAAPDAPGKVMGLVMCGLFCGSLIPILGVILSIGALVCWIIYWVQIAGFSGKLAATAE